jgi:hypothetical protein
MNRATLAAWVVSTIDDTRNLRIELKLMCR